MPYFPNIVILITLNRYTVNKLIKIKFFDTILL
jgi:hypothetical protein